MFEAITKEIRTRLGDIEVILGQGVPEFTDQYLLQFIQSANEFLGATDIIDEPYNIVEVDGDIVITPEPEKIDILLLATYSTYLLLRKDLVKKVRDGELGIRFRSGQDEISTLEASRQVMGSARDISKEYRQLVVGKLSERASAFQRIQ